METCEMKNWEEFEEERRSLESQRAALESKGRGNYVSPVLFRGQGSSDWKLETTWERYRPNPPSNSVGYYYRGIFLAKPQIESSTERRWEIPTCDEFLKQLNQQECPTLPELPGYDFWVYLRHFRFPSPLLDWSRSPYVAAFFAFNDVASQPGNRVAIFAYQEYIGEPKRRHPQAAYISTTGPYVRTHMRHVLQQSDYTLGLVRVPDEWCFASHETALDSVPNQREIMRKFTIPSTDRTKVLRMLDRFNLNAYSLFGSEESLVASVANREFMFRPPGL
jgi:hypothetical protein